MKIGDLYISNTSIYDFSPADGVPGSPAPVGSIALIVKMYDSKVKYVSLDKIFCISELSFYRFHDPIAVG